MITQPRSSKMSARSRLLASLLLIMCLFARPLLAADDDELRWRPGMLIAASSRGTNVKVYEYSGDPRNPEGRLVESDEDPYGNILIVFLPKAGKKYVLEGDRDPVKIAPPLTERQYDELFYPPGRYPIGVLRD